MRIATWCVSSIKARLPYLRHWLQKRRPDMVALQKTFSSTDQFPREVLLKEGYESVSHTIDGEFRNGWGVAVLSRKSLPKPKVLHEGLPGDSLARFLTVRVGELEFSSVYAPYGGPGYRGIEWALRNKIAWMNQLCEHIRRRSPRSRFWILAGEFGVAPDGKPVTPGSEPYTQAERDALISLLGLGFDDLFRHCHPNAITQPGYNYGFYRTDGPTSRVHLMLGTNAVSGQISNAWVDLAYRRPIKGFEKHSFAPAAPIVVDLKQQGAG